MSTFPIAPINGEIATVANVAYQYSSSTNAWRRVIGNISTLSVAGNTSTGNLLTGGYVTATGNITGSYIIGNGSQLTGLPAGYSNSNAVAYGQSGWGGNIIPSSNAVYSLGTAALQWKSLYVSNTTVYIGDVPLSTEGNVLTVAGNTVITATGSNLYVSGMISATGNIQGNYVLGNGSQLTGLPEQYGNANVAAYLPTYTGNLTAGNISATGNITGAYIIGNGSQLTGLPAGYANSNAASYFASGNVTTDILTTANVSATGNVTGSYIIGNGSTLTSVTGANVSGTVANATYATSAGTAATVTTNAQPNITSVGTLTSVTATGNATAGNVLTGGLISATGNVNGGNILTAGLMSSTGNAIHGNILTAGLISATSTITSAGNLVSTSNVLSQNYFLSTTAAGGLRYSGALSGTWNIYDHNTPSSGFKTINFGTGQTGSPATTTINIGSQYGTSNTIVYGNLIVANTITSLSTGVANFLGNITGANLLTAGLISATGNISTAGIINTANIYGSAGETISTGGNANINLYPGGTGNIVLPSGNATYINNLASPVNNSDAATKQYVDNAVSTQLSYHQAVTAATTANLAATTGGTITYTQPNGAGNGVGALITTTGSFNLIDTANVQTANTRILVKDEGNAVLNGIYSWANATAIIRTTDADEYGPSSSEQLSINDYFFVTSGNVNAGSAWIVDAPSGTITFGTSNITFAQFSSSQTYSAGNGISFAGTVVSARVDSVTTAFDGGGNITVKASANLTTPNIGAATGTSISVSANVTGGNIVTAGIMSSTGNAIHGNILTAGLISATSTITSAANVTGGNITTTGLITVTGNATAGNIATAGLITATGNLQAGNIRTAGLVSATGNVTGNYFIGNGSALTGITLSGAMTWTTQANTAPSNVAAGSFWYDSYSGVKYQYTNDGTGNVWVDQSFPTSFSSLAVTGNATIGGNLGVTGTLTYGNISTTGNVDGGNLRTTGVVTATGNITGGNILTAGLISATGNITVGGNLVITGNITDATQIDITTTGSNANIVLTPNGTGNVNTPANVSVTGNVTGGNIRTSGNLLIGPGTATYQLVVSGNANTAVVAQVINANTGTAATSILQLQTSGANYVNYTTSGSAGYHAIQGVSSIVTGYYDFNNHAFRNQGGSQQVLIGNGGATVNYLQLQGSLTTVALPITAAGTDANISISLTPKGSGNVTTAANVSVTGNVTAGNVSVGTGTVTLGNIVNANGNGVGNIGSSSLYFNTIFAKATSAQYADLAEMYVSDQELSPGTVVEFGGTHEIRECQTSHSTAVAGIVSTNPSYLMNAAQPGDKVVAVALTGRVPCQVIGTIHKGDRLVASDIAGVATALDMTRYEPGCIIGKALESYDNNNIGVIEVAVGRT